MPKGKNVAVIKEKRTVADKAKENPNHWFQEPDHT